MSDQFYDWMEESISGHDTGDYKASISSALLAIAYVLRDFLGEEQDEDKIPAGPIPYPEFGDGSASS